MVLTDGASHAVDSSELAFKLAALYAFRQVHFLHHLIYSFYRSFVHYLLYLKWHCSILILLLVNPLPTHQKFYLYSLEGDKIS